MKKEVYEKLLENLANITPEEKKREWKKLKKYNEIGPEIKEIIKTNNMEKKIGEIFIFNDKQFQVVEGGCTDCYFQYENCSYLEDFNEFSCSFRKDGKFVGFKLIK